MRISLALLAAGLCLAPACRAAQDCAALESAFRANLAENRLDAAVLQLPAIETACPDTQVKDAKRHYTDALAKAANALVNQNRLDAAETLLAQAQALSWTVAAVRGDIAAKRKDWRDAAQQYGQAFALLTEPGHVAPGEVRDPHALQQRLYALASDAQLVYGKLDTSVTRGGAAQGILLAADGSRDIGIQQTALPVHFETGKAFLDADGEQSAAMLAAFLSDKTNRKVILTGYADPRGSTGHNQELSEARAKTVADYLKTHGIGIPIATLGKGETEPPVAALDNLTQDEQWARWRRVELQLLNP